MLTAGLLAVGTAAAGAASPADEATFVSKINALRASKGLAALTPDAALAATACTWNDQMIAAGTISHDPNLAAAIASVSSNWRKGGENVGMGGTVDSLFDAFVASPGHYANLVDPQYTRVGVCVGRDANGKLFTTHRFIAIAGDGAPPPPPPTTAAPASNASTAAHRAAHDRRRTGDCRAPDRASDHRGTAAPPPPTTAAHVTAPAAPPTTPAPVPPTTPAPAPQPRRARCSSRCFPRRRPRPPSRRRPQWPTCTSSSSRSSRRSRRSCTCASRSRAGRQTGAVTVGRSAASAIVADGLTRSFNGQLALVDLTLEASPGEVLAVLGPNGAGKTTTVRLLNGVLAPDRGSSRVLGIDPALDGNEVRRRTGVLTENAGLDDRLTAWENLVVTGRIRGMNKTDAGTKATAMLERFGMADRADHRVQGFSTGQRKRVALGRALLHDPDILFLDEPTSGLDPDATRDVIDLIGTLAEEHGRTVVLCTHFLGEAGRLAHRMAVLDRGHLLAFGTPAELAGEIWKGLDVNLDLGAPADDALVAMLAAAPGVLTVRSTGSGAVVTVNERAVIPRVVASLTSGEVPVYGAVPMPPTLEDVYFAVVHDQADKAER